MCLARYQGVLGHLPAFALARGCTFPTEPLILKHACALALSLPQHRTHDTDTREWRRQCMPQHEARHAHRTVPCEWQATKKKTQKQLHPKPSHVCCGNLAKTSSTEASVIRWLSESRRDTIDHA